MFEIEFDPEIALGSHFNRRAGETRRPHILNGDHRTGFHQFKACFQEKLFREGITHLNGGAFFLRRIVKFRRGHGGAMNAVTPRFGPQIDNRIADAGGCRIENLIAAGDAHRHRIHQNIAVIAFVESDLSANGRDAEGIAVATDARHNPRDQMAGARMGRVTEPQGIQTGNRACAHGEDIAQNAAHTGGCALIGFDEGGVVVAFHFEDAGQPVANVDDTGILTRSLDHPRRFGRQALQMQTGGLIGTMLVPHRRKNTEFGQAGGAANQRQNALIFIRLETMLGNQIRCDVRIVPVTFARIACHTTRSIHSRNGQSEVSKRLQCHAALARLAKRPRPSVPPMMSSIRFSGCGIMPRTRRFSDKMPAISLIDPLGLAPNVRVPSAWQ